MTLLEAGDRLVKKTGLYRMTMIDPVEPRSLRWVPLLILAAITVGYALMVRVGAPGFLRGPDPQARFALLIVGTMLFFGGFAISVYVRFLGPRLGARLGSEELDERELAIRARAFAWSGSIIGWGAVAACFWFGAATLLGGWMPRRPQEWLYLGMALEAWILTLPVSIASWLQPREVGEGD
jgi:hypothetical protein